MNSPCLMFSSIKLYSSDLLRIFVNQDPINKVINICLLDPYHLVATDNYKTLFQQNRNNYKYCYSALKALTNI